MDKVGTKAGLVDGVRGIAPGVALCLAAAGVSYGASVVIPNLSPLLVAIILGVIVANTSGVSKTLSPGVSFSAKKLLRLGIVLLGLKLVLGDIWALGLPVIMLVVAVVGVGILGTILIGRLLRVPRQLTTLVACGFSICGAAAVAGAAGVTDPDEKNEEATVTAVALVVIFGTLMIAVAPLVTAAVGMDPMQAGIWVGASVHEVAQVVAAGGIIGGGVLTVAVIVKLARVLLLAPVMMALSLWVRRRETAGGSDLDKRKLPPIVPLFVVGFLGMVIIRSFVPLQEGQLAVAGIAQTALLAAAMFALGTGVRAKVLKEVGLRPFALATLSTLLVASIAYIGVVTLGLGS